MLVIIVLVIFLGIFAIDHALAMGILSSVKDGIIAGFTGIAVAFVSTIENSAFSKVQVFAIGGTIFGFAVAMVIWQGHNFYNWVRQKSARSIQKEAWGTTSVAVPLSTTPPNAVSRPTQPLPPVEQNQQPPAQQPPQEQTKQ